MIVYFLRHASAGERKSNLKKDEQRALDREGVAQCNLMGRVLAALDVHVDLILTSPLKRASQTAALVGNEIGYEGKLHQESGLRPEADWEDFRPLLEKNARLDAIMVVGHNPNLSEFLGAVVGRSEDARFDLRKGAIARVEMGKRGGTLDWCLTPRVVRAAQESSALSSRPKTSRK
jgi:phosphohistidine phosphatase